MLPQTIPREKSLHKDQNNAFRFTVQFSGGSEEGVDNITGAPLPHTEHYTDVLPNSTLPSRERQTGWVGG